jgi:hypothetical protein
MAWSELSNNKRGNVCITLRHLSKTSYCGKATTITYSVCVCVCVRAPLVIQHANCIRHIILSSVACLAVPYFSTLSHKWHGFWEKSHWTYNVCFDFFLKLLSETFLIIRGIQWGIINVRTSSCEEPIILVRFNQTWPFSIDLGGGG